MLTRIAAERLGIVLVKKGIIKPLKEGLDPEKFAKGVALAVSFLATVFTTFTLDIPFLNYGLNFAPDKLFPGQRHE